MRFLLLFIPFISVFTQAQELVIKGRVLDKDLGKPIEAVNVVWRSGGATETTDSKGNFEMKLSGKEATLRFSHVAFRDTSIRIRLTGTEQDTLRRIILLEFNPVRVDVAYVEEVRKPDTVYGAKNWHVVDIAILQEKLLLLTAGKEDRWKRQENSTLTSHKDCGLVILDENSRPLDSIPIPGQAVQFYTDYLEDVFIITEDLKYRCAFERNRLTIQPVEEESFDLHIIPAFDTLKSVLYYSTYAPDFPAFDYLAHFNGEKPDSALRHIEEEWQMELLRSEYKYLNTREKLTAFRLELETGVDKEIIAAWMSGFANSLYARPLYAPCFIVQDTICIFDHTSEQLIRYNDQRQAVDSSALHYQDPPKPDKWKRLLHDRAAEKVYSCYDRHGYLYVQELDLRTGRTMYSQRLYFRYPEKVLIHKGMVYYVYRPFESSQKRFLYKEILG